MRPGYAYPDGARGRLLVRTDQEVLDALAAFAPFEATADMVLAEMARPSAGPVIGQVRDSLSRLARLGRVERVIGPTGLRGWRQRE